VEEDLGSLLACFFLFFFPSRRARPLDEEDETLSSKDDGDAVGLALLVEEDLGSLLTCFLFFFPPRRARSLGESEASGDAVGSALLESKDLLGVFLLSWWCFVFPLETLRRPCLVVVATAAEAVAKTKRRTARVKRVIVMVVFELLYVVRYDVFL